MVATFFVNDPLRTILISVFLLVFHRIYGAFVHSHMVPVQQTSQMVVSFVSPVQFA